jgi:hypothetical protein
VKVPWSVVEAHPDLWDWPGKETEPAGAPVVNDTALQELSALTVPELQSMAQEAGIELPSRARKSEIIEALNAA